jgi:hypothetical protein
MSKMSELVLVAFQHNDDKTVSEVYVLHGERVLDEELVLQINRETVANDLLENAVRFLERASFHYGDAVELDQFKVKFSPEVNKEYFTWFIQFFAALENSELAEISPYLNKASSSVEAIFNSPNCDEKFDLDHMKFTREKFPVLEQN